MNLRLAQLVVGASLAGNLDRMLRVLEDARPDEWVVFPEGMLSGYAPAEPDFTARLDPAEIERGIEALAGAVRAKAVRCLFGTALPDGAGRWYNAGLYLDADGRRWAYHKVNLATLDRNHFVAGGALDVLDAGGWRAGMQLCRDNAFPEQWKVLKRKGAQVIFHLNNSVQPWDAVREHLLIARAFENQVHVVSVNNAAAPQALPSLVVAPSGRVLCRLPVQVEEVRTLSIDVSEAGDQYLRQERRDLVDLQFD